MKQTERSAGTICCGVVIDAKYCVSKGMEEIRGMRSPVKINRSILPTWLGNILPSKGDPRNICRSTVDIDSYEDSVSAIRIGATWKRTQIRRHVQTDSLIDELVSRYQSPSILEIGASCGTTSLDLLNRIAGRYRRFYVTDQYFEIPYMIDKGATYFYHPVFHHCIIRASEWFIVYEDLQDALYPLGTIARRLLARAPTYSPESASVATMLHPRLRGYATKDSRIIIEEYDIFEKWSHAPVEIVKVANVLNESYFSREEIEKAIVNIRDALVPSGRLVLTDNRVTEKVSVFRMIMTGRFVLEEQVDGGSDIEKIVMSV